MAQDKKPNDFKDRVKVGIITAVYPQDKTVDIKYTSQAGNALALKLPYASVSGTWGSIHMPIIGDRVLIDNTMGELPVIKSMYPLNTNYLPYLDPGEVAHQSENGSYIHLKNRRKRVISTNTLIAYDADTGPNGETDIQYEPGGVTLRARSHQTQDEVSPNWNEHSYLSLYDNGDVNLQSMVSGITKGLLHFDGASGHAWWHAGDKKVQEYIELNPIKKEIVVFSDGDMHQHTQTDHKINTYGNQILNFCGAWQVKTGVPTANIPADFDLIVLDDDLNPGDIRIDNTGTDGCIVYIHSSSDFNILVDEGDIDVSTSEGDINITSDEGDMTLSTDDGEITLQASDDITITGNNVNIVAPADSFDGTDAAKGLIPGAGLVGLGNSVDFINQLEASTLNVAGSAGIFQNAISSNDIMTFESHMFLKRFDDLSKFATAMIAAGVPNAGAVIAQLATLVHIPIPGGSSNVKVNP